MGVHLVVLMQHKINCHAFALLNYSNALQLSSSWSQFNVCVLIYICAHNIWSKGVIYQYN